MDIIKSGQGDIGRLNHIVEMLRRGSALYSSDQKYLESILGENTFKPDNQTPQIPKVDPDRKTEQTELREKLARGEITIEEYDLLTDLMRKRSTQKQSWRKNKKLSLIMSLLPGVVGLQGIGYFQLRKYLRGIEVLAFSIIAIAVFFTIPTIQRSDASVIPSTMTLRLIVVAIWFSVLAWQFYDTKKLFEESVSDRRDRSYKSRKLRSFGRKYCLVMSGLGLLALMAILAAKIL